MAVKKSELYSSIWKSCDELRKGMDASQYKDYVLPLLFVKYVSDKYAGQHYAPIKIPAGGSFADMQAAKGKTNIGERINTVIKALAEANELNGIIDTADFDDKSKLGDGDEIKETLTNLIAIFEDPSLDFSKNRAQDDDLLGDAYEYLMRNFATQSGKSKGQFYTPAEVSRVMAKIIGIENATSSEQTIYDPTCGSGSLLLKAADEAPVEVTIYGQENDVATRALAKMNMILHDNTTATIERANTITNPRFRERERLQLFDFAVANPPFSSKAWSNGIKPEEDEFDRFIDGIPPNKNGDYAFFQHLLRSLKSTGKGAIILPHGVLFRGNVEAEIRESIIKRGYIKGIIGLPANLFYGTGIPACIIVVDKENAGNERSIFMIDASKGYIKDGNKNRLRHQDIHKIVDVFNSQKEITGYSRMVPFAVIKDNEFNLNIPRYIPNTDPEDKQDIEAHLLGGIPEGDINQDLKACWEVFPAVAEELFQNNERAGYLDLKVEASAIKPTIFGHPEFVQYAEQVNAVFVAWVKQHMDGLKGIQLDDKPKQIVELISEDLLDRFAPVALIDKYDVYQSVMTYWTDVMQDDVYMLVAEGWMDANKIPEMRNYLEILEDLEKRHLELTETLAKLDEQYGAKKALLAPAKHGSRFTKKKVENLFKKARQTPFPIDDLEIVQDCHDAFMEREKAIEQIAIATDRLADLLAETMIPLELVIARYFPSEQDAINTLEAQAEDIKSQMDELEQEHGGEGGLLYESKSDKGNLGKGSANDRLTLIEGQPELAEDGESDMIQRWLDLNEQKSNLDSEVKEAIADLNEKILRKYPTLSENEIKVLVIEDKWLTRIEADIQGELDRVSQRLTGRIKQLADRYATPLPEIEARVMRASERVKQHLKNMGYNADD